MIDTFLTDGDDTAIVNPVQHPRSPRLGPVALLVSPKADLNRFRHRMSWLKKEFYRLYLSRLYQSSTDGPGISLAGPMIGAPYAVMILETLIAWGCRQFIFFGWCGAIGENVRTGDIIIPTEAMIDEGTSRLYIGRDIRSVKPAGELTQALSRSFTGRECNVLDGPVWSTDAIYRETKSRVRHFQQVGVLGVDMELSALFSIARYRSVDIAGVMVVSDELSSLTWRPGFKSARFKAARITALEGALACCQEFIK